jgi:FkbM family methyltransferase
VREGFFEPVGRLWNRPDFRRNPVQALGRRVLWRARWAYRSEPWWLSLANGGKILVPKGGSGALIYYLGSSEPETAQFLLRFLRLGMVFWDVGAHIGEFSLLASRQVGETGRVDAFEPHPRLGDLIRRTIEANQVANMEVHSHAVTDRPGAAEFVLDTEPSTSHLRVTQEETKAPSVSVSTLPLSDFHRTCARTPHLVKVDVEGAEKMVLGGAQSLLRLSPETAPVWIMEFAPENCARFRYHPQELLDEFRRHGYRSFWLTLAGLAEIQPGRATGRDCLNFVSTKNEGQLRARLAQPPGSHPAAS